MSASRDGREPLSNVRVRVQASVVGWERELGLVLVPTRGRSRPG